MSSSGCARWILPGSSVDSRLFGLIDRAIADLELDLRGLTVLTEAASGAFICTALTAARAGATVLAVTRSSAWGAVDEVTAHARRCADALGVAGQLTIVADRPHAVAAHADIVTNLGFVRPIDATLIAVLPPWAVIPLMWEPWELRPEDVDLPACALHGIPVIGTNEHHPRLSTFEYVGVLAIKLLLEEGLELEGNVVGLVASDPFGGAVERRLRANGATVCRWSADHQAPLSVTDVAGLDALVVAEHRLRTPIVADVGLVRPDDLVAAGVRLVHISGVVDGASLTRAGLVKYPAREVPAGVMTVTTGHVGPKPLVDLHAAGLRVGEAAVRCRRAGGTVAAAVVAAEATGFGLRVDPETARQGSG